MKGAVKSKGNLGHAILTGAITMVMAFGIVVPTAGILHRAVEYKLSEARFDKRKVPSEPTVTPMETAPVQEEVVPKSELTELSENYQAQISSLEGQIAELSANAHAESDRYAGVANMRFLPDENVWVYDVHRGDTLSKISRITNYSVDQLANINQIRRVNLIYTGSSLRVPNN